MQLNPIINPKRKLRLASASTGLVYDNITEGFACDVNAREVVRRILIVGILAIVLFYIYTMAL